MNIEQKRKILRRIALVQQDIDALKDARLEVARSGYASATLASSGGSKSYTRINIKELTDLLSELSEELIGLRGLIAGQPPCRFGTILTVRS